MTTCKHFYFIYKQWFFFFTHSFFFVARYAQFLIGVHYERGFDMPQDLKKAKYFYGKSADGGFPDAQAALGSRLIVEQHYDEAIYWLEKAIQMV